MACRSLVAQPGAPTARGVVAGDAAAEEAAEEAEDAPAEDAAADEAEDEGADTAEVADATGGGGAVEELPAAQPATTAPAAATPASLSNNETEPVITINPF